MRTTLGGGDDGVDDLVEALAAAGAEEFEREGADFLGPAHALEVAEEVGVDVVEGGGGGEMGEEVGFEGFWGGWCCGGCGGGIGWGGHIFLCFEHCIIGEVRGVGVIESE